MHSDLLSSAESVLAALLSNGRLAGFASGHSPLLFRWWTEKMHCWKDCFGNLGNIVANGRFVNLFSSTSFYTITSTQYEDRSICHFDFRRIIFRKASFSWKGVMWTLYAKKVSLRLLLMMMLQSGPGDLLRIEDKKKYGFCIIHSEGIFGRRDFFAEDEKVMDQMVLGNKNDRRVING